MSELGQLQSHHQEFAARGVRIVAASTDNQEDTATSQKKFPHLVILSDEKESLAQASQVLGPHHSPTGKEVVSPTTVFVDRTGMVRGVYRAENYLTRLSPAEVLAKANEYFSKK